MPPRGTRWRYGRPETCRYEGGAGKRPAGSSLCVAQPS
jgi:hypothetical protein